MRLLRPVSLSLLAGMLLWTAGCGGAAPAAPSQPAAGTPSQPQAAAPKQLTHVEFLLDWLAEGHQSPFYLALEKGYYKDAGLDVKIVPGKGSGNTSEQVGKGNYPLGFADAATAATAVSKGVGLKVVAAYIQKSDVAIISKADANIAKPSDLIGKKIGTSAGSASDNLFKAFLAANHLKPDQVSLVNMSSDAKVAALQTGKVDAILNLELDTVPTLAAHGMKSKALVFSDWGVDALSTSVIANDSYAQAHPDVIKAFIAASNKGWADAAKDPQAAIAAEQKLAGDKIPDGSLGMLQIALRLLHTKGSEGHPLGWMAPADWDSTLKVLHDYLGVTDIKSADTYYTNQFIGS